MKGLLQRLQAIEEKLDRILQIFDDPEAEEERPGNRCYRWQAADDKLLRRMHKEGASDEEIGNKLHRTPKGVCARRNKLGLTRRGTQ